MTPDEAREARDDVTTWKAAYLSLLDSWTRLCDLAGVEGDSAPGEVVAAIRAECRAAALDVERLARAIDNFITSQTGFDVDDAHAIAAEYARLAEADRGA